MKESQKRTILVAVVLLSIVPPVLLVRYPEVSTLKTFALYLSAIFGYVGVVIMLWSYILGAKSVAGLVFKDLAQVLSIHKWLGKYGTLAIFLHPILVIYSYGESWLYAFLPQIGTQFERHVTLGRISLLLVALIWVTSAIVRGKIRFRPWRYIHLLVYISVPFALLHVPNVGSQYMAHTTVKAYLFSLGIVYVIFSLLKLRGMLNLDKEGYTVVMQRQLVADDPNVYLVQLRPNSRRVVPKPGQYVYVKDGFISEEHPFSVLDYDATTGDITIAYRTFGRFTAEFSRRQKGSVVYVGGPYGEFTREILLDEDSPLVFIAGGIGVTPMLQHLIRHDHRERWLFYANRSHASAMLMSELKQVLGDRLVPVFSRESSVGVAEEQGHFDGNMLQKYIAEPAKYRYFICGSDVMMTDVTANLEKLGVPTTRVHRESFGW